MPVTDPSNIYEGPWTALYGLRPKIWGSPWPRTEDRRINRMNKYVAWKRMKIRERHWIHVRVFLGVVAYLMLGVPVIISLASVVWGWAIKSVF
jgi:hypothetical protein